MNTPEQAIRSLVDQAQLLLGGATDHRKAFEKVIAQLDVKPGDPAWSNGSDVLARAFEQVVPQEQRRPEGQFFTPLWIGEAMARWALADGPRLLLDPGCGSGSLLVAADRCRRSKQTRFLGLDSDPLAIAMAERNKKLRSIQRTSFRHFDYLLDNLEERPDAVICNPPYTRHQELSSEYKAEIHARCQERLGFSLSRLASLHVHFLLRSLDISSDDARLAFITPAHWLDTNYSRVVKKHLVESARIDAIVIFAAPEMLFPGVRTTAAITLIRKGKSQGKNTRVAHLSKKPSPEAVRKAVSEQVGEKVDLASSGKWSHPGQRRTRGVPLSELATVRRGLATGCNGFFVLSENERREWSLDTSYLRSCVPSPRLLVAAEVSDRSLGALDPDCPRWLLTAKPKRYRGALNRYLSYGKRSFEADSPYLVRQRVARGRPWYSISVTFESPILFSYFNRGNPRFVRNRAAAVPLNNWLAIEPRNGISSDHLFSVLSELAPDRLRAEGRLYGSGMWKLEPSELGNLRIPTSAATRLTRGT